MKKLLTIQQLSELIQISRNTLYEWTHIGFIPHCKFPKGIHFRVSDIERWLQKRKKRGKSAYREIPTISGIERDSVVDLLG